MIDLVSSTGILGAIVLLLGAGWPIGDRALKKNQLYILGNALMLVYALLNHFFGSGAFFFILLQILVNVGSWLGVSQVSESLRTSIIGIIGLLFIGWSLLLFEDSTTIYFIVGLTILALGFSQKRPVRKQLMLAIGSVLIAYFSYLVWDPIFLGLNAFFALFSGYYYLKTR